MVSIFGLEKLMNVKIFVACHNQLPIIQGDILEPIQVGKALSKLDLGILSDNTGDNISELNPYFCELTALYWVWKNCQNLDYVGLYHYRRFFSIPDIKSELELLIYRTKFWLNGYSHKYYYHFLQKNPLCNSSEFIKSSLDQYDLLLPKKYFLDESIRSDYKNKHFYEDLEEVRSILYVEYEKFIPYFDLVFSRSYLYPFNMFIMKQKYFNEYCEWLFDVLFKLEKRINYKCRNSYQQRVFGFIAERLFNVFIGKLCFETPQLKLRELFIFKSS